MPQFTFVSQITTFHPRVSSYTGVLLLSPGAEPSFVWGFSFLLSDCTVIFCGLAQPKYIILIAIVDWLLSEFRFYCTKPTFSSAV